MPADDRAELLGLLRVEGEVAEAYAGLGPEDEVVWPPDYDDDEE